MNKYFADVRNIDTLLRVTCLNELLIKNTPTSTRSYYQNRLCIILKTLFDGKHFFILNLAEHGETVARQSEVVEPVSQSGKRRRKLSRGSTDGRGHLQEQLFLESRREQA